MRQKNWRFKSILLFLSFALAFPVGVFSALAANEINHTAPEGKYVPGFRIQLDVGIQNSADLLAARCYFKTKQDQNFAFVDLFNQGGGKFQAVLPAPWLNSEAVEYLFVAVDNGKKVTRSSLFVIEEGQTKEAAKWKDANQVEQVRLDNAQEGIEDYEVVRRQLVKNHGKKLPKFQRVDNVDPLKVQTELSKDQVPLHGFYDKAVITEVADSAKYGAAVEGLYSSGQIAAAGSSPWWSSKPAMIVGGVVVAGGVVALASGGGGGGGGGTKEICHNGIDDDGDGLIDEGDCVSLQEICGDGIDNDYDGQIDEGCPEICGDGKDNDGDGLIDEGCSSATEICGDGIDNDGDGLTDEGCPEICGDGIDNDGDGLVDEGCSTTPGALTADTILGFWNFDGYRRDGVSRYGNMTFNNGGNLSYSLTDADGQNTGSGTGTWSLSGTSLSISFLTSTGTPPSSWLGTVTGNDEAFTLDTSSGSNHGVYDFTR